MPWSGQGGGGGPWKPGSQGPWGQGPSGQQTPPDLEDLVRRSQDKPKQIMPGGGAPGGATTAILVLAALALWGLSGFYTVRPDEIGVNQVFGKYVGRTGPGLNWNWPYPVGHVVKPRVTAVNAIEIGARIEDTFLISGPNLGQDSQILRVETELLEKLAV